MTFANPALIALLTLVSLPLLLHLFARTRPPSYAFSSVAFLQKVVRSTMRVKKPRDLLLLILRTLAVLALILAFLRPIIFSQKSLAASADQKNIVLLVDASASMAGIDGAQSRFAAACARASEAIDSLSASDQANVIWLKATPDPVFPALGTGFDFLLDTLRKSTVSDETAPIEPAIRLATEMLADAQGKREIWLISDFQESTWKNSKAPTIPDGIDLINVPVATTESTNKAITSLNIQPPRPLVGETVTILCEVKNYSSQPRTAEVFLEAGEIRQRQELQIGAWDQASATFPIRFTSPGDTSVKVSLDQDTFSGDDQRHSIVRVDQHINAAIFSGTFPDTAAVWHNVLDAFGWAKTTNLDTSDLNQDLAAYDLIMLAGWSGEGIDSLKNTSATIIALPAPDAPLAHFASLLNEQTATDQTAILSQPQNPASIQISAPQDPVFQLFASGEFGDPASAKFSRHITATLPGKSETLLSFANNSPALARSGRLHLWNLPLDQTPGTWSSRPEFLSLLGEIIFAARSRSDASLIDPFETGTRISLQTTQDILSADISLTSLKGESLAFDISRSDSTLPVLLSQTPPKIGIYRWQLFGQTVGFSTVNFPASESDLRTLDPDKIDSSTQASSTLTAGKAVNNLRDGQPLWPWMIAAAALFLITEGYIALRSESARQTAA